MISMAKNAFTMLSITARDPLGLSKNPNSKGDTQAVQNTKSTRNDCQFLQSKKNYKNTKYSNPINVTVTKNIGQKKTMEMKDPPSKKKLKKILKKIPAWFPVNLAL